MIKDYLAGKAKDLVNNTESEIKLPSSNVLQFFYRRWHKNKHETLGYRTEN